MAYHHDDKPGGGLLMGAGAALLMVACCALLPLIVAGGAIAGIGGDPRQPLGDRHRHRPAGPRTHRDRPAPQR